jgi:hypothetical protein
LPAISFSAFQNASSRFTLVFLPLKTIDRLKIIDFGMETYFRQLFANAAIAASRVGS